MVLPSNVLILHPIKEFFERIFIFFAPICLFSKYLIISINSLLDGRVAEDSTVFSGAKSIIFAKASVIG